MAVWRGVRLGRITVVCLALTAAGLVGVLGPRFWGDAAARTKTLATMKRKFEALHDFALFRSRGDKAVLRWGERQRHPHEKTDTSAVRRPRHTPPVSGEADLLKVPTSSPD